MATSKGWGKVTIKAEISDTIEIQADDHADYVDYDYTTPVALGENMKVRADYDYYRGTSHIVSYEGDLLSFGTYHGRWRISFDR
ncbi:hypothetical protein COK29_26235, partial [Bacillus cereus]|uniref:hypothetical protein n=1 Tax=Bacillus cereus TaxID=1396 RepID=UPI000C0035E0